MTADIKPEAHMVVGGGDRGYFFSTGSITFIGSLCHVTTTTCPASSQMSSAGFGNAHEIQARAGWGTPAAPRNQFARFLYRPKGSSSCALFGWKVVRVTIHLKLKRTSARHALFLAVSRSASVMAATTRAKKLFTGIRGISHTDE
ncbi:hypothetical protein ACWGQQ_43775 [Bradyrhizobium sp. Lot33]